MALMTKDVVALLRPEQWVKNLFVALPLFFSGKMMQASYWDSVLWAFVAFSLAASGIYVVNDIIDAEQDRLHPEKCRRPMARRAVSCSVAVGVAVVLLSGSLVMSWWLTGWHTACMVAAYAVLNLAYCFKLKQVAVLDVLVVALGFVLRLLAGGVATGIVVSHWLVMMTFLLTLFLALAKRRDDVIIFERQGVKARGNVTHYNLAFINQAMSVMASVMIVCYVMYTVSPEVTQRLHTSYLYATTLFVVAGVIRYMQIAAVEEKSGNPTKVLLHDRFVQCCVLGWALSFFMILYV